MTPSELQDLRKQHKVSLIELAEKSGVDVSKITAFETGEAELTEETVQMLVETVKRVGNL